MPVPLVFRIFWIAPILIGAIVILSAAQKYSDAEASAQWTPVTAKISRIGGQRGFLMSQMWGSYRWERNGKSYEGSEIDCCGSKWDTWFKDAGTKKDGDEVTAWVDPADPARAVLVTGTSARCLMPIAAGLVLIAAGFWIRLRITADVGIDRDRRGF